MFLYISQPRSTTKNNIINFASKNRILESFENLGLSYFKGKQVRGTDLITLFSDGVVLDGMLTLTGYQNILVVTSFMDNNYDRLRDRNYRPVKSAGDHTLPIVHKFNESVGNMYVTKVKNDDSYFAQIYDKIGIPSVIMNSPFRIDGDLKLKTDVKFDAVVLLGCESYKQGNFSVKEVKNKFAKYCTEDFDLIDVYRGDRRKLKGRTKSIETQKTKFIEVINTPKKIYDHNTRIDMSKSWHFMRQRLMYLRLSLNIEKMNEYYRKY